MRVLVFIVLVLFLTSCSSHKNIEYPKTLKELKYSFLDITDESYKTLKRHKCGIDSLAITPNGRYIVSSANCNKLSSTIKLWDIKSGQLIKIIKRLDKITSIAITPNSQYIIISDENDFIMLDIKDIFDSIEITPNSQIIENSSNSIELWNVKYQIKFFDRKNGNLDCIAITPNGQYIIVGSERDIELWDVKNKKLIKTFKGKKYKYNKILSIAVTPNGHYIVSSNLHNDIELRDIKSGKLIKTFIGHQDHIHSVTVTSNGRYVVSGSNDKTIKLWDIESGKLIKTFRGHKSNIHSIAITPNNRYIVSGSDDETIRLWDIKSGELIKTFRGHQSYVRSITITPNGRYIVSGSWDNTIKLWDIESAIKNKDKDIDIDFFYSFINNQIVTTTKIVYPFKSIQNITQYLTNTYLKPRKIIKETPPPEVKKPKLPPAPKLTKSEYETQAMFQKRVNQAIAQREAKVKALQKRYRQNVEERNKKIEAIQKRYLAEIERVKKEQTHKKSIITQKIIEFQKDAFKAVMGDFVLEKRSYDAENQILYATMRATRANYSKKISLKVPLNEVKNFVAHLKDTKVDARFDFTGSQIILKSINANYQNKSFVAILNEKDFKPKNIEVAIKDKKVKFDSAKQMRLTLQNPNLKDTYQIEALAYSDGQEITGVNYQDDIPKLLESINQTPQTPKKWLFVIGAEKYDNTDSVTYSKRSAEIFTQVAQKSLGVTARNTYALIGDRATSGAIEDKLNRMLENVKEGDSIYFFYSGHGIPVLPNRVPYLLPKDKIPDYIGRNSFFKLSSIYNLLSNSKASRVIAIMDSCFSGSTDGKSVFKGVAGSVLIPKKVTFDHQKMVVLTAGRDRQFSNMYPKRGHRLFSYFVMKALLEGKRSVSDIYNSVYPNVKSVSNGFGDLKRQEPTIEGNEGLRF